MLTIDGSQGEGGGQVVRSSLALSMLTQQPVRVEKVRAGRKKPGLMRQHLTALRAAAEVCDAQIEGDAIGSRELTFTPGAIRPGDYTFRIPTAGSCTLVLQTVLPALLHADGPSTVALGGGTHNPWAPPFDFLLRALLPLLNRIGWTVEAELIRPGFYPAGGGEMYVRIAPTTQTTPLELRERGQPVSRSARALVARLAPQIAERELRIVRHKLGWAEDELHVEVVRSSIGPGNILFLETAFEHVTEVFTGFGAPGVRAETVARKVVEQARTYLAADVPVGEHLADQLLVPLLLCGGQFRTFGPSRHTRTNIDVIRQFVDVRIRCEQLGPKDWQIDVPAAVL